jgi:predicted transcriptional regulator
MTSPPNQDVVLRRYRGEDMAPRRKRLSVNLDDEHAAKLAMIAERVHLQRGALAGLLLSRAIEETGADTSTVVQILEAIPGALERAQRGLEQAQSGRGTLLDDL